MEELGIKKIFDLDKLEVDSQVEGITNLSDINKGRLIRENIINSRGEFVGYFSDEESLNLFRDRVGGRNLYYTINDEKAYVSTDILWVVRNRKWVFQLNLNYINSQYLEFQIPFNEETIYKHVYKVMPGEIVTFHKKGVFREKYWSISKYFNEQKFNPKYLLDLIIYAIEFRKKIIEENFTSYLSGGIDSSSITLLSKPQVCFTGYYDQKEYSELDYVRAVLQQGGFDNIRVEIKENSFYDLLKELPKIMPDPMAGLGVIPQALVSLAASPNYKYAFTGEGGDEVFGGYPWNYAIMEQVKNLRLLGERDKYLVGWGPMINKMLHHAFVGFTATALGRGPNKEKQLELIESVWDYDQSVENNLFLININIGLPCILTVDECVGRYSGVVPVSPLIDHNIIEYVASVSLEERWKIPKYLLRKSMEDILPEKILYRSDKQGFPVPIEYWSWSMIKPLLESLKKREIIEVDLDKYRVMSRQVWGLINIELICRELEGRRE